MGCGTYLNFVKGEGAARPTKQLWLLMIVYGALSTYGEVLGMLFGLLTVPLQKFYNESIYSHYGFYLDEEGMSIIISIIANLPILGSSLSVVFLIPKMDSWGRKGVSLHVRSFIGVIVAICFISAKLFNSVELFILGEFILGLYGPLKMAVVKHYLSECAPTAYRGFITHSSTMLVIFALLPMTMLLNPGILGNEDRWHYMGYVSLGLNFLSYVIGLHLPESPKYLYFKGKPKSQVIHAIRAYQGQDVDIDETLDSYYKESKLTHAQQLKFVDLWRDETLRNSLLLVCLIVFGTTWTISAILMRYETILLLEFGFTQEGILFLVTILQIIILPCILFVPILFEKLGRRPLILFGTMLHIILPIIIFAAKFLSDTSGPNAWSMILGLISLFMQAASNFSGHSAIYLILIADMIPEGAKVIVSQICLLISIIGPFPIIFLYPILVQFLSGFVFLPFSLIQLFIAYYLYQNLFETKQKEVYKNVETMEGQVRSRATSFFTPGLIRRQRASTIHGFLPKIHENENSMLQPLLGGEPKRKYGRIERFGSLSSGVKDWA